MAGNLSELARYAYGFRPAGRPVLTSWAISRIVEAALRLGRGERAYLPVTLDLGLSVSRVAVTRDSVELPGGEALSVSELREWLDAMSEGDVLTAVGGELRKVAIAAGGSYYRLRAVAPDTAPTLEINGIHMHRISGVTPWEDTLAKVRCARVRRGARVLDVCTGLGYTAVASLAAGAFRVVTVEVDPNVLEIASYNPWSRGLADERVTVLLGDATELVPMLPDSSFDRAIHDPPAIYAAGELYSREFYGELFRVLRPGGILFHYTGKTGHTRGVDVARGVARRLREVGFEAVIVRQVLGVVARKPRGRP